MCKYCLIFFCKYLEHLYGWVSLEVSGTRAPWKSRYNILVPAVHRLMAPYVIYILYVLYIFVFIQHFPCVFSVSTLFPLETLEIEPLLGVPRSWYDSASTCLGSQVCPVPRLCSVQHILPLQLLTHVRDWLVTLISLTTFHSISRFCREGLWNWMKELCSMGKSLPVLLKHGGLTQHREGFARHLEDQGEAAEAGTCSSVIGKCIPAVMSRVALQIPS